MKEALEYNEDDRVVSYLPSSHSAGFGVDIMVPLIMGSCTYYAKPDAL